MIDDKTDALLSAAAARHPYPLLFVTSSGARPYGFASADADFDLRGVHLLPVREVVGLAGGPEKFELQETRDGVDRDLVTHDVRKFFELLLRHNGYVLEQVYSPLIVRSTDSHRELCTIARGCITRGHAHHYLGFAATNGHY